MRTTHGWQDSAYEQDRDPFLEEADEREPRAHRGGSHVNERRVMGLLDEPDIEEVLSRAEDLLARSRGRPEAPVPPPPPPGELPTLTEVAENDEDALAVARPLEPAPDAGNLRLEMLAQLAPVLERLVDEHVAQRLSSVAGNIAQLVKEQLEREIKFIVREAIDQALLGEIERLESARARS